MMSVDSGAYGKRSIDRSKIQTVCEASIGYFQCKSGVSIDLETQKSKVSNERKYLSSKYSKKSGNLA